MFLTVILLPDLGWTFDCLPSLWSTHPNLSLTCLTLINLVLTSGSPPRQHQHPMTNNLASFLASLGSVCGAITLFLNPQMLPTSLAFLKSLGQPLIPPHEYPFHWGLFWAPQFTLFPYPTFLSKELVWVSEPTWVYFQWLLIHLWVLAGWGLISVTAPFK